MADTVVVSVIHPMTFRDSKTDKGTKYTTGIHTMPYKHAQELGLLHRQVRTVEGAIVQKVPFNGAFGEPLVSILSNAGYETLADLRRASRDELTALEGIGPANYERILTAVKGGN